MRHSLKHGAGYLIVDHRDSPGLTAADVAHVPGAKAVASGTVGEWDILQCNHCEKEVRLEPLRVRDRGHCHKCDHYVCDWCNVLRIKTGECKPMALILDTTQRHVEQFLGQPDHPDAGQPLLLTL